MPALETPLCDFGWPAPDFSLPDTKGQTVSRDEAMGTNGLLVMFICNHCPYVKAILDRLMGDVAALQAKGIGVVAISANDAATYPADGPDQMAALASEMMFAFPYLYDETQEVAKAYGAVCTPDFFGFDAKGGLQYRGRLDAYKLDPAPDNRKRELVEAMTAVAEGRPGPQAQVPSMGCSIKWKMQ